MVVCFGIEFAVRVSLAVLRHGRRLGTQAVFKVHLSFQGDGPVESDQNPIDRCMYREPSHSTDLAYAWRRSQEANLACLGR